MTTTSGQSPSGSTERTTHTEIDTPEGLELTTLDIERHAPALADMWNASDANWPGTWTGGVPETAESVRKEYARQEAIETFICMDGEVIAGFCKVMPDLDEPGVDYVALVNVPPSHQKRGLARRLLQRAAVLAVERASNRLDLHTWSANLSAVPLYKKVGFMWMPDTDIHMLNFIPAVLRLDAAQDFFATRDWYRVFRRPLDQEPDEERWEGMKVFTYRFADSPDAPEDAPPAFVARVDREARAICAVETTAFAVSATTERLDPARGAEVTLRWTITNRGSEALPVTILASGTDELLIDHRVSASVAPGATEVLEGTCRISPDAKDVKPEKPVPAIKSVVLLGDQVVELSTGLRPRPALEVTTWPSRITLVPGGRRKVHVRLRNRLDRDVKVDLRATGAKGLELGWAQQELAVPAEGWCGAELEVAVPAGHSGAYALDLSVTATGEGINLRVEPNPRHVFAVGPGDVVAAREKESLRVENTHFRAVINERGAGFSLYNPLTGQPRAGAYALAGPPFSPSEFWTIDHQLDFIRTEAGIETVATGRSKRWPGFVTRTRVRFNAGPVVEQLAEVENGEAEPRQVQIMQGFRRGGSTGGGGRQFMAVAEGLRAGQGFENFPGSDDEDAKKPERFVEQWWAVEGLDGNVVGAVWAGDVEEVQGGGTSVLHAKVELAPQQRLTAEPLWVWCGPGRWQAVRDLWRQRQSIAVAIDPVPDKPAEPIAVSVDPGPWLVTRATGTATVSIEHADTWPIEGTAKLVAPTGWKLDRDEIDLSDTTRSRPARAEVTATPPDGGGTAGVIRVEVRGRQYDRDLDLAVLSLAEAPEPSVRRATDCGRELWSVSAGVSELRVAPDHGGSTVSWKVNGMEQFASDYPEASSIGPWLPWHGGISPILVMGETWFPGRLWAETFTAEEIDEKDGRGNLWRGVKVVTTPEHEDLKGMRVEALTLALSGAPVLKHVIRAHNGTGAWQSPMVGALVYCAPGGDRSATKSYGEDLALNPSDRYSFTARGTWAAAVNGSSGATVLIASRREVGTAKLGTDGGHLYNFRQPEINPGATSEAVSYLVAAESLEAAKPWRALTEL